MSSRQLNHVFPTLVGEVTTRPASRQVHEFRSSFRMEIKNTMRQAVFWKNALGVLICEPPLAATTADEYFYIVIEYEFDRGVKIDSRELLNELNLPDNHVERKSILAALNNIDATPQWNQRKFSYTLGLSRETLESAGGIVYLNDVDLVVGFDSYREEAIHPFTQAGQQKCLSEAIEKYAGMQQRYMLVDNSGIHGSRWVNTGYGVFELKPLADPQYRDGVYVTTSNGVEKEPKTTYHPFPDAEKALGLYRSRAEAEAFGSPDARFQQEIKELERDVTREKAELTRRKHEMDMEKTDLERERARQEEYQRDAELKRQRHREEMERERERLKMEKERLDFERSNYSDRQKFEFDMSSRDRKDRSEYVKGLVDIAKAGLSLVTVGLSLYVLIQKNQK